MIKIDIPLSISGDRELKGQVNESLIKHYFSKVLQPSSVHLVRLDTSVGSGNYVDLSAETSSIGNTGDAPVFGTSATMTANDEFYIADSRAMKEFWVNTITAGVFTATGIEIWDSTNGVSFNRQLAGVVDASNAFRNAGWKKISWTQPATVSVSLALAATSNDTALNTSRVWYKVKLLGFTAVTTAPILARIAPIFIDTEQKYDDFSALMGLSKTTHVGNPLINVTYFTAEGDEIITTYSNPPRGFSIYSFRKNLLPADAVSTIKYLASDDTWKDVQSYNDESNVFRNGPTVLTEPPLHYDVTFATPSDIAEKTISISLSDNTTFSATGYHFKQTFTSFPTKIESPAGVVAMRALQYGSANTSGITVPAFTTTRVSVELNGSITGTADESVFQITNLTTGKATTISIPSTAVTGDIVNIDIADMTFASGDNLGLERVSGSRTFNSLSFNLL